MPMYLSLDAQLAQLMDETASDHWRMVHGRPDDDWKVSVTGPAHRDPGSTDGGMTNSQFWQMIVDEVVPEGAPYVFITEDMVPTDRTFRDDWRFDPDVGLSITLTEGTILYGTTGDDVVTITQFTNSEALSTSALMTDAISTGGIAATLYGRDGDDQLVGAGLKENLVGQGGNDHLDGRAGADILNGGGGNDTLTWAKNDKFLGGSGFDTIKVASDGVVDLKAFSDTRIDSIEHLTLGGARNSVVIRASDVLDMSSTDTLRIDGNHDDSVSMGAGWHADGITQVGGHSYHEFSRGLATLLVDVDI